MTERKMTDINKERLEIKAERLAARLADREAAREMAILSQYNNQKVLPGESLFFSVLPTSGILQVLYLHFPPDVEIKKGSLATIMIRGERMGSNSRDIKVSANTTHARLDMEVMEGDIAQLVANFDAPESAVSALFLIQTDKGPMSKGE